MPWVAHEGWIQQMSPSWPPSSLRELAAIAQPHGVPTRLLDFTVNPLAAAYFSATVPCPEAASTAVWAEDRSFIESGWAPFKSGVRVVQVSRGANPFLHAQSGLFLYDAEDTRQPLDRLILDHDLERQEHIPQTTKEILAESHRVRCLTLRSTEHSSLLSRLADRRVTEAHLRPTLETLSHTSWTVRELVATLGP
jgi:hypothetical protein